MITGNQSILKRANEAKENTRAGTVEERIALAVTENKAIDYSTGTKNTKSSLIDELGSEGLLEPNEVTALQKSDTIVIGDRTIDFSPLNIHIGNIVTATGLKKFKDLDGYDIEWIYFGKDENGNNLITTEKPLPNEHGFQFFLNKQTSVDNQDENSAKNWLYYDLQATDEGYSDDECTGENNINKFCANLYSSLYSNGENEVGKARSITLEDINRVTGFEPPQFNKYIFGTTNNYSDTSVTGNHTVDYYYPSLAAKNQSTDTSVSPAVIKYWIKATGSSDSKLFDSDGYIYIRFDNNIYLNWEGSAGGYEVLEDNASWKLEKPENMLYVTGKNNNYSYAVGSRSIRLYSNYATFRVSRVAERYGR